MISASPSAPSLEPRDHSHLDEAGIAPESAERQLRILRGGMRHPVLLRPGTRDDGIDALPENPDETRALTEAFLEACKQGRWVHFIPASGAATRMADALVKLLDQSPEISEQELRDQAGRGDAVAREALKLWNGWHSLPFAETVSDRAPEAPRLHREGRAGELFAALLRGEGKGLLELPKGLVPFHRRAGRAATPVEEHVREAAALAGGAEARLHFTIAPGHEARFLREVEAVLARLRGEGVRAAVTHSFQDPATQTLALDARDEPFRDAAGKLVLRPGGHGSLLRNLANVAAGQGADFAWIRNIDNIPVETRRAEGRALRRVLGGLLMRHAARSAARPVRVCGMVQNTGEPGGGPFWIETPDGPALRIVESAEVSSNPEQQRIFRAGTHFNPVDLACSLRDPSGKPFALEDFSDPAACFIAGKTHEGRALKALEWPGLWNGAMAKWETHCVEIPLSQFAPVKTVADLLRPEHQG